MITLTQGMALGPSNLSILVRDAVRGAAGPAKHHLFHLPN